MSHVSKLTCGAGGCEVGAKGSEAVDFRGGPGLVVTPLPSPELSVVITGQLSGQSDSEVRIRGAENSCV